MSKKSKTRVIAEYVWVHNNELYSKSRTIEIKSLDELEIKNLPKWHFNEDGDKKSDDKIKIEPISLFNCPFRGQNGILVFCKTENTKLKLTKNTDMYKVSQEYYIINPNLQRPLNFPANVHPNSYKNYFCSVGLDKSYGRKMADLHYKLCISSGVKITELENRKSPAQWCYTVEANSHNDICAQLWMSRYILQRVGEISSIHMNLSHNPMNNETWNKSYCYVSINDEVKIHEADINPYQTL